MAFPITLGDKTIKLSLAAYCAKSEDASPLAGLLIQLQRERERPQGAQ